MYFENLGLQYVFKSFPMDTKFQNTKDLNDILAQVGGFWSSISGIGFLCLTIILKRSFFDKLIKELHDEKKESGEYDLHQPSVDMTTAQEQELLHQQQVATEFK